MNEPAFPRSSANWNSAQEGMSIRDYFAAKAMESLIMKWSLLEDREFCYSDPQQCSSMAYKFADAMLEERNENHG